MSGIYKGVQAITLQKNLVHFFLPVVHIRSLNLYGVYEVESSNKIKRFLGSFITYLAQVQLGGKFYNILLVFHCTDYQILIGV